MIELVIILYAHETYHARADVVYIGVVYANVGEFRVKLNKLLTEPAVRAGTPESPATVAASVFNGVGKQEITVRQDCKITHKIINLNAALITAVHTVHKDTVGMTVHYVELTPLREYVKAVYRAVIACTLALAVKTAQELAFVIKKEQCIG